MVLSEATASCFHPTTISAGHSTPQVLDGLERARAEAAIGGWKQVIGDGLRAHTDERRAIEVDVAVLALNRMLELRRPSCVRLA
jgi:hypothetical protein